MPDNTSRFHNTHTARLSPIDYRKAMRAIRELKGQVEPPLIDAVIPTLQPNWARKWEPHGCVCGTKLILRII